MSLPIKNKTEPIIKNKTEPIFNFKEYAKNIIEKFKQKTSIKQNEDLFEDILLDDYIKENINIIKKCKKNKTNTNENWIIVANCDRRIYRI